MVAAISTIFNGKTTMPVSDAYALILPGLSKMTPFAREAIMTPMIETGAVKG